MGESIITRQNSVITIPLFTAEDEGKVLQIVNGSLVWAELSIEGSDDNGYCWVISQGVVSVYSNAGALINQYDAGDTWKCPSDGNYYVELHALGGKGGNGVVKIASVQVVTSYGLTSYQGTAAIATGGGGGGSGAYVNVSLTKNQTYPIVVSDDVTKFDTYYCNRGSNGSNGTISGTSTLSATAGTGGAAGTYASGMTGIATAGENGKTDLCNNGSINQYAFINGGALGGGKSFYETDLFSSGSSIFKGNYGNGTGAVMGSYGAMQQKTETKESGVYGSGAVPAIIIVKRPA